MRFRLLIGLFMVAAVITACQGPPPTVIYIVISPTPDGTEVASSLAAATPKCSQEVATSASGDAQQPSSTATANISPIRQPQRADQHFDTAAANPG